MKKRITAITAITMACIMCAGLAACGTTSNSTAAESSAAVSESTAVGMANPIEEVTKEELAERTGIELSAPEGAEDVVYTIINMTDGPDIAQVDFTLDGHSFFERAVPTDLTSLSGEAAADVNADVSAIVDVDAEIGNISGMYYEWTAYGTEVVSNREAYACWSDEGPCLIVWLDAVPGILYNLGCDDHVDADALMAYAEAVFVPLQGDC